MRKFRIFYKTKPITEEILEGAKFEDAFCGKYISIDNPMYDLILKVEEIK